MIDIFSDLSLKFSTAWDKRRKYDGPYKLCAATLPDGIIPNTPYTFINAKNKNWACLAPDSRGIIAMFFEDLRK
jgi:hypothetical protein